MRDILALISMVNPALGAVATVIDVVANIETEPKKIVGLGGVIAVLKDICERNTIQIAEKKDIEAVIEVLESVKKLNEVIS